MDKLNNDTLLELLLSYDSYIQEANDCDFYENGWKPVCIKEFYYNDFNSGGNDE